MWYDQDTEYALVEPVATNPDYRRQGLGRAAVMEGIKRCGKLGAKQAYVGSGQQFYYQIGFHPLPAGTFWVQG
jgi:predicted N-acetyltransferase YhbS